MIVRLREPLSSQQLETRTERWLVIDPSTVPPVSAAAGAGRCPGGPRPLNIPHGGGKHLLKRGYSPPRSPSSGPDRPWRPTRRGTAGECRGAPGECRRRDGDGDAVAAQRVPFTIPLPFQDGRLLPALARPACLRRSSSSSIPPPPHPPSLPRPSLPHPSLIHPSSSSIPPSIHPPPSLFILPILLLRGTFFCPKGPRTDPPHWENSDFGTPCPALSLGGLLTALIPGGVTSLIPGVSPP